MLKKYGLYKSNNVFWVALSIRNGDFYMVDPCQVNEPVTDEKDLISHIIKSQNFSPVTSEPYFKWMYYCSFKVTEDTENNFEFVCDLRDYEIAGNDIDDYSEKDIVRNVILWDVHRSQKKYSLLRKGAKKDATKVIENLCKKIVNQINSSYVDDNEIENIKLLAEDSDDKQISHKIERLEKLVEGYKSIRDQQNVLLNEYFGRSYEANSEY